MNRRLSPEDAAVLHGVLDALAHLRRINVPYAGLFSPAHEDGIHEALRRMTVTVREEPLGRSDIEVVTPPVFGRYVMVISSDVDRIRRQFARRHGLGHVAAGHVAEITFLSNTRDHTHHVERVADVFALADLTPWPWLDELRENGYPWRAVRQEMVQMIRYYTIDWPETRVLDRADLRIALYREHGL